LDVLEPKSTTIPALGVSNTYKAVVAQVNQRYVWGGLKKRRKSTNELVVMQIPTTNQASVV